MKRLLLPLLLLLPLIVNAQCVPMPAPYLQNFDYITTFYRKKPFPIYLGLVTDTSNISDSFCLLKYDSVRSTDWTEIRFNTANNPYPTTATARFAILMPSGYNDNAYVDDIDIHHSPTCLRPENVSCLDKTSTTFEVAWSSSSAARV